MGIPHQFYHKTLKTLSFLRRSLKIGNRQSKLRTNLLFAHFLSMQLLYGIPILQVRPRPLRRSNAEQQDGSPTDIARHHALTPCLMPSTGQHSKNDAGELDWRCSTSSTMVMSPSTPATCLNHQAADRAPERITPAATTFHPAGHSTDRCRSSPGPYQTGTDCPRRL